MAEYITCRNCSSPDCRGCNVYTLAMMLSTGKFDCLTNGNRCVDRFADVAPVRHGRWIEKKRWGIGKWHKWLECSECGHQDHDLDMYEDMPFTSSGNYCPNCGARMDGE